MFQTIQSLARYILGIAFLFISSISFGQEELVLKEYSYAQLFSMIEAETDTVFQLKDAIIILDTLTDSEYYVSPQELTDALTSGRKNKIHLIKTIDKHIVFENVNFKDNMRNWMVTPSGVFKNIRFKKTIKCTNVFSLKIFDCQFDDDVMFRWNKNFSEEDNVMFATNNTFKGSFRIQARTTPLSAFDAKQQVFVSNNIFDQDENESTVFLWNEKIIWNFGLTGNKFIGEGSVFINSSQPNMLEVTNNQFNCFVSIDFQIEDLVPSTFRISENTFEQNIEFAITNLSPSLDIEWEQFEDKLFSKKGRVFQMEELMKGKTIAALQSSSTELQKINLSYATTFRIQNSKAYKTEMALRGEFFNYYKSRFDKESSNAVYMELKDLETERLKFKYTESPNFDRYFKWKINQFLKVFSDYGTNPAKSIIFSIYVIFIFGAFYLFFPNSWDAHGRNRIIHRYGFFMKYMVKDAGIHEVYLEEKQREFNEYNAFSNVIKESKNKVPRFFTTTSLLLLKWAKSGSVISAFMLKRIDVMKGKWADLTKGKRVWKSILLIFIFTLAIIYDLFIKMLNALMLSINTFTTLGFGEIPIRGLPRYLAIVQGFVGWFLLTIFSVSLISQLME